MKILQIHNAYQQAGGEDVVVELERRMLQNYGHRVVAYVRCNREMQSWPFWRKLALPGTMVWDEGSRKDVLSLLHTEHPDVVHVHNTMFMVSPAVYSACREAGVPVVQTLHNYRLVCPGANLMREGAPCEACVGRGVWRGVLHGCYRHSRLETAAVASMITVHRWRRTWVDEVDAYIALSRVARDRFIAGGLPPDKLFLKPNFVYPDPGFSFATGSYLLYAGRLSEEKGITTLLSAWSSPGEHPPLLIAGDGPMRKAVAAASEHIDAIRYLGPCSKRETLDLIRGALAIVVPSHCYENFPMIVAEAFAVGRPIIAADLGSMAEIVEEGRTGLLFRPRDAEQLAHRATWASIHAQQMHDMGSEARLEYELRYTAAINYSILRQIYARVMQLTPGAAIAA